MTSKITETSLNISTGFVPAWTVLYGDIDDDELIKAGIAADAEALKSQVAELRKEQCKTWSVTDSILTSQSTAPSPKPRVIPWTLWSHPHSQFARKLTMLLKN